MTRVPGTDRVAPRHARRDWILAAILVTATFIVYQPALHGERLLDDDVHITRPELRSLAGLARIWTDIGATQQYYPVLHSAFWLEYRLWGDAVFGYHVTNVLLHCVSALLVVALVRRLDLPGGWLAAFIFALHPVAVESVAWISEQKNTLSTVFYLAAAISFFRFHANRALGRFVAASAFFACALLSKTATATLPAALLVVLWWRSGRLELKRDVAPLVPWLVAALVAGSATLNVERALISGINADLSLTWTERILVAGRALWFYAGKMLWPANPSFLYERWEVAPAEVSQILFPVLALVFGVACVWLARRWRGPLAAALYFAGTLLPVLGFVDVEWFVFSYVADHLQYLASLGVIIPVAALAAALAETFSPARRRLALTAAAAFACALATSSWQHSSAFQGNIALYERAAARAPNSVAAHYLLGVALGEDPARREEAIAAYEKALRLNPDAARIREGLGSLLLQLPGRRQEAIAQLVSALRLAPGSRTIRHLLAAAWFDEGMAKAQSAGREDEVIAAYQRAVELNADFLEAHFNLGNVLLRTPGRRDDAVVHYQAAIRLKPDFAEAHTNLGTILARQPGRLDEAITHFEAALRAKPDFVPAQRNLERARQLRD